jgi:methylmalonyl-CoA/ethylmalonyl-CoA epimerase
MIKKIDHIGIVVRDLEASISLYRDVLKLELVKREQNPAFNVDIAFFRCGETLIELLSPYGPGMNQEFLDETGGGIHHICYEVDDIEAAFADTEAALGHKSPEIQPGAGGSRIFFVDPSRIDNVDTEFAQFPK